MSDANPAQPQPTPPPAPPAKPDMANCPVVLVRHDMLNLPIVPMPAGYSMRPMALSDAAEWEDVWIDAEPFVAIRRGLFMEQFGKDPEAIPQRCFLLVGPDGSTQGTISAWYDRNFKGGDWGRIHWVAVKKASQGKGLARAMMSFAMQELKKRHTRAELDTSTGRVGAIKVYLDFGFVPDMDAPHAAEAWAAFRKKLDHPGLGRAG
ncbi:MAG: GNAT family N-acetyltransferase [Planctomycetota bacterium]|nr:GNAT family N-acetyltransferase [Planctomycetota bacterium]